MIREDPICEKCERVMHLVRDEWDVNRCYHRDYECQTDGCRQNWRTESETDRIQQIRDSLPEDIRSYLDLLPDNELERNLSRQTFEEMREDMSDFYDKFSR